MIHTERLFQDRLRIARLFLGGGIVACSKRALGQKVDRCTHARVRMPMLRLLDGPSPLEQWLRLVDASESKIERPEIMNARRSRASVCLDGPLQHLFRGAELSLIHIHYGQIGKVGGNIVVRSRALMNGERFVVTANGLVVAATSLVHDPQVIQCNAGIAIARTTF